MQKVQSNHCRHGLGKDVLCSAPPDGCRDMQPPTWSIYVRGAFQWGSSGWEAEACTPPGVLLRYLWGFCLMSRLIYTIYVADLIAFIFTKAP